MSLCLRVCLADLLCLSMLFFAVSCCCCALVFAFAFVGFCCFMHLVRAFALVSFASFFNSLCGEALRPPPQPPSSATKSASLVAPAMETDACSSVGHAVYYPQNSWLNSISNKSARFLALNRKNIQYKPLSWHKSPASPCAKSDAR